MLRELCDALDIITKEFPLVIILEDVHWADPYTVDWLSALARGNRIARLMVIATFRRVALGLSQSPLKTVSQRLISLGLCREIALARLTESEVQGYLEGRAPNGQLPSGLTQLVFQHSEGNPFFMRLILDHLFAHGWLTLQNGIWAASEELRKSETIVPERLRELLENHFDSQLSIKEQQVLEAASVCGITFAAAFIDTAAEMNQEEVEEVCERLSKQSHCIRIVGTMDLSVGQFSGQFKFAHLLYREMFYRRAPRSRRVRFHRKIAEKMEALYDGHLEEIAPILAYHFEKCSEPTRAAQYLCLSAKIETQRFAYSSAIQIIERALNLIQGYSDPGTDTVRLSLLRQFAEVHSLTDAFFPAIEKLETAFSLSILSGNNRASIQIQMDLAWFYLRIDGKRCIGVANRALELSLNEDDPFQRAAARMCAYFWKVNCEGWNAEFANECWKAFEELQQSSNLVDLARGRVMYAVLLTMSSKYSEAIPLFEASNRILVSAGIPFSRYTQAFEAYALCLAGEWGRALERAQTHLSSARKNGNQIREHVWQIMLAMIHQQALDHVGTVELCRQSLPVFQSPETQWFRLLCLTLLGGSEVYLGDLEEARNHLKQAEALREYKDVVTPFSWEVQLYLAMIHLALCSGAVGEAKEASLMLTSACEQVANRTWRAIAWEAHARIALAEGDLTQARVCIDKAIELMEGYDLPLAYWRVHRTAMQVYPDDIDYHRRLAARTVLALAESLNDHAALKNTFLSSLEVGSVL
jgi:tetratricopeptide (TPR) repeat protein